MSDPAYSEHSEAESLENSLSYLEAELGEGLRKYWHFAGELLKGSGIRLVEPQKEIFSLERNFFSVLFLYSYFRSHIPKDRRILYVAVNQCLRGMVTGCDNLLDEEYKMTLDTDLPDEAVRFRSVLDIMVSDRVLLELMSEYCQANGVSYDLVAQASAASLRALTRSGAQEASEEKGIQMRLPPGDVLSKVHHYKTGILFQCTWAVPSIIEGDHNSIFELMKDALYWIGIGCQILDDMVDLIRDVRTQRHNYVASLIYYGVDDGARNRLEDTASLDSSAAFFSEFPQVYTEAYDAVSKYLHSGLKALFLDAHQFLMEPAAAFIAQRIGVDRILTDSNRKRP